MQIDRSTDKSIYKDMMMDKNKIANIEKKYYMTEASFNRAGGLSIKLQVNVNLSKIVRNGKNFGRPTQFII